MHDSLEIRPSERAGIGISKYYGCALRHLRTHAREFQKQLAGRGRHQPTQRHLAGIFHSLVIFSRHSKFDLSWEYLSDTTSTSKNVSLPRLTKRSVKSEKAAKNRILSILIILFDFENKIRRFDIHSSYQETTYQNGWTIRCCKSSKMFFKLEMTFSKMAAKEWSSNCGEVENGHLPKRRRPFRIRRNPRCCRMSHLETWNNETHIGCLFLPFTELSNPQQVCHGLDPRPWPCYPYERYCDIL